MAKKSIHVTKFDGSRQAYLRWKVVRTCVRMGASEQVANKIVDKIETKLYDGIRTKKILQMIFRYMRQYKPEIAYQIDLRNAISLLRSKPDFEKFVGTLLEEQGYSIKTNQFVDGECITHEIDAIATKTKGKKEEVLYVEVKHHSRPHTYTGVEVALETYARFLDMKAGYKTGKNKIGFTRAALICNTKLSEHAERYAQHKKIMSIGWNSPKDHGLERIIEKYKLYPITFLKSMNRDTAIRLIDEGIILLRQLVRADLDELSKRISLPKTKLKDLVANAEKVLQA